MTNPPTKGSLEGNYKRIFLNDWSGGFNTYKGSLNLSANEFPDGANVFPVPGALLYVGGWSSFSDLPAAADMAYPPCDRGAFYDSAGSKHLPVWAGGYLYDVVNGTAVQIVDATQDPPVPESYTAGERVGVMDNNGIIYWSTESVPLRYWNPATGEVGAVVQTGPDAPPASPCLFYYAGSIVACGVKWGSSAFQPNVFSWSGVNQAGYWHAVNSQAVGPNNGEGIVFGTVMGVAEVGVPPTENFIIGRSDNGIYSYHGAIFIPHQRIALAVQNNHVCSASMAVRFLIGLRLYFRDVG